MRRMADSIHVEDLPDNMDMYLGYIDGEYANYDQVKARFPDKIVIPVTVFATDNEGLLLDVENGDATPQQAPGWVDLRRRAGVEPSIYCSLSTIQQVYICFSQSGIRITPICSADYGRPGFEYPHINDGCVATQWVDHGLWDESLVEDYWPGIDDYFNRTGDINVQGKDFFKRLVFREGGYINIRRNGEADIPAGVQWQGYTVMRADGSMFTFPYNGVQMYSQLPPGDRMIADPTQDYLVDAWQ